MIPIVIKLLREVTALNKFTEDLQGRNDRTNSDVWKLELRVKILERAVAAMAFTILAMMIILAWRLGPK